MDVGELYADLFLPILIFVIVFVLPAAITLINIWNLFSEYTHKPVKPRGMLCITMLAGIFDYTMLFCISWDTAGDYYKVVNTMQTHNTIDSKHFLSVALPLIVGVIGLLVISLFDSRNVPPLVSCFSIAGIIIGNIVWTVYGIQLWEKIKVGDVQCMLYIFHFNILLLSAFQIRKQIKEQVLLMKERNTQFRYKWIKWLYNFMSSTLRMSIVAFVCILPLAAVLELILILFGQGPDGIVKAFTMTADWTFSTQIPPPPIEYEGHYLCTVAAGGHRKLVKPTRYGRRLGQIIIVNRQLCIANAFEELIHDRIPGLHKRLRHFYDTYGYPVSRIITTPQRADIVYVIMKPLEILFLIVLYMFDVNPEQRIVRQYPLERLD